MQLATFYPDRISIKTYKKGSINQAYDCWVSKHTKDNSINNLRKKRINLSISKSGKRNIINSVNSLFYHSKKRTIKLSSGKFIYSYKASFITLTLPSKQVHSDVEIKERLNVFLQQLRQGYGVNNYVWKAELQANENIHFHLIVDKYINYNAIKYYWNKCIKPLGYIDEYAKKFDKMSFNEYVNYRSGNCDINKRTYFDSYKKAYFKGKETKWRSPNSVDVKSINNTKSLSHYLAKYLTKPTNVGDDDNENSMLLERVEKFGKLWSRSQSLSRLKFINRIDYAEIKEVVIKLKKKGNCCIDKVYDYCRVIYLKLENCPKWFLQLHRTVLNSMARLDKYPFPT